MPVKRNSVLEFVVGMTQAHAHLEDIFARQDRVLQVNLRPTRDDGSVLLEYRVIEDHSIWAYAVLMIRQREESKTFEGEVVLTYMRHQKLPERYREVVLAYPLNCAGKAAQEVASWIEAFLTSAVVTLSTPHLSLLRVTD